LKIVLLGDSGVGKTALSIRGKLKTKTLPQEIPPVCKTWHKKIDIEKHQPAQITVYDWPADRPIKKLKHVKADIYLLCYDIGKIESFKNIKEKYLKELYENQEKSVWI